MVDMMVESNYNTLLEGLVGLPNHMIKEIITSHPS